MTKKRLTKEALIDQLFQNNVVLQEKVVDLVSEIKTLTDKIDDMVTLFQQAAKHIKEGTDQPLIKKIDELLEQNKSIAKGLILLEKYVREKSATEAIRPFGRPLQKSEL